MKYKIVLKKTDQGYAVSCPGLPGCWSQGDSRPFANIQVAIQDYLAAVDDALCGADVREIEVQLVTPV